MLQSQGEMGNKSPVKQQGKASREKKVYFQTKPYAYIEITRK